MKFKVVMGYIYLTIFIGAFGYKFFTVIEGHDDAPVITFMVITVVLAITLLIRKLIFGDS